jgi:hypothetical protein
LTLAMRGPILLEMSMEEIRDNVRSLDSFPRGNWVAGFSRSVYPIPIGY